MKEKIKIDCHNHTKWSINDQSVIGSDWFDYVEDFAKVAREKELTMCSITEHDNVNRKLKEILWDTEIIVPESVEISAKNYDRNKSLHILYYAKTVSEEVDELLSGVLNKKKQMLKWQIEILSKFWFKINFSDVFEYITKKWHWEDWINKWNITKYIFLWLNKDFNVKYFDENFWDINIWWEEVYSWFYHNCMKSEWEFYDQFRVNTDKYEPCVKEIWELAKKDNAILSIAHPNFTFKKGIEEFKKELPYYVEKWVNAIEINAKASEDWVEVIIEVKEKYNLILTFGSDCHAIWLDDDKHANFGTMNPYIESEKYEYLIKENLDKFREKTGV